MVAELRRRRVFRALLAWGVVSFAVLQVVEPMMHGLDLPPWTLRAAIWILAAGFPVTSALAWTFDLGPGGVTWTSDAPQNGSGPPPLSRHRLVAAMAVLVAASTALGAGLAYLSLRQVEHPPPVDADGRLRIAVADFTNDTRDPDLDGLSWMLVNSLAESRKLSVVTRTRMIDELRRAGRQDVPVLDEAAGRDAARVLGVRRLVLASVHRLGDRHTIDLRVLDPQTGEYVFAFQERGEGKGTVQDLIDRVSQRTRERLHAEGSPEVGTSSTKVATVTTFSLEAWRHYTRGLALQDSQRDGAALEAYRQAVALDPEFALAHYRILRANALLSVSDTELAASMQAVLRGVDRLPSKERQVVLALQAKAEGRYDDAVAIAVRAAQAFPQDKEIPFVVGDLLYWRHRLDEALPWFERSLGLDPTYGPALLEMIDTLIGLGRREEAISRATEVTGRWPSGGTLRKLAYALAADGRFEEAVEVGRKAYVLQPSLPQRVGLANTLVWAGRAPEAEALLAPVFAPGGSPEDRQQSVMVMLHALEHQGRHREAIRLLDEFPDYPAFLWFRLAINCGPVWPVKRVPSDRASLVLEVAKEIMRRGVKADDLVACFTVLGEDGLANEAAKRNPDHLRQAEAFRAWRDGDLTTSLAILRELVARMRGPWARGFLQWWVSVVAFETGNYPEAVEAMAAFEREGLGPWRAWGLAELLVRRAMAEQEMGRPDLAAASLDRFLQASKRADPDLPLLAEARALRAKLEKPRAVQGGNP